MLNGVAHAPSDLITAISASANDDVSDDDLGEIERSACPTCGSCSGMFTANSMNFLTEALGLSLPGNGSVLATHVARKALFEEAGRLVVDLATRFYRDDDESVLLRNVASKAAFENAMTLDVAMGGSTNTVLHFLAAAQEAGLNFTIDDIDAGNRRVGCICKVAPNSDYHMEDVHRAVGISAILGELDRAGLLNRDVTTVHSTSTDQWLGDWDIRSGATTDQATERFYAAPGGARTVEPFSTDNRWKKLDTDAAEGCIRDLEHAYTVEGGLAILLGNLADDGCVIKSAGIDESLFSFSGPARVVESQDDGSRPSSRASSSRVTCWWCATKARRWAGYARDAVYHGLPEGRRVGRRVCAGYRRPWMPADRDRTVTTALRTYAAFASSASTGAVRDLCRIHER